MNNITIVVVEASFLIQKGLNTLLEKMGGNQLIQKMNKEDGLFDSLSALNPNILILNPDLFDQDAGIINQEFSKLKDCKLVLISNAKDIDKKYTADAFIHYNDEEVKILECLSKLKQACLKKEESEIEDGPISAREKNILKHVALGLTNKEIADQLFISVHTVVTHRKNITQKLGIKSVSGLTVYAILNNLITMDEVK